MGAKLTRTPGPGRDRLDRLEGLNGHGVAVGDPDALYDDGEGGERIPVAALLEIHEYGLGVPQRAIVRPVLATRSSELANRTADAARAVMDGASPEQALGGPGRFLSDAFVAQLQGGLAPLDPDTVKGDRGRVSSRPLQRTGQILAYLRTLRFNRE
jgi:hypothetical protein